LIISRVILGIIRRALRPVTGSSMEDSMTSENSLPSYQQLFGDLDFPAGEDSRCVYSPAAYLADLLQLVGDGDGTAPGRLTGRRPDLTGIPLDAENIYTELPYLDIVNEVLAREIERNSSGEIDTAEVLDTLRHPFQVPFSVRHDRLRRYLRHLGVDPADLYRQFAATANADVVARECLGLTPAGVTLVTTALGDGKPLRDCYRLDEKASDPFADLEDVETFLRVTSMSGAELRTLLFGELSAHGDPAERGRASAFFIHHGVEPVVLDETGTRLVCGYYRGRVPIQWFDQVNRFVRLARLLDLPFGDLDLVLRTCCDRVIDLGALRVLAVVVHLHRTLDLPIDVVVSLVKPINVLGVGDAGTPADLFNRMFNAPFVAHDRTVLRVPAHEFRGYAGLPALTVTGDVLAPANAAWRRRVAAALHTDEKSLEGIVERFRDRLSPGATGPFDRGADPYRMLGLLHRVTRLAAALDVSAAELLDTVEVVERDRTLPRFHALPILIDTEPVGGDCFALLDERDLASGLWLVQTLVAVTGWMRSADLTAAELRGMIGGDGQPEETTALGERLGEQVDLAGITPELFRSERFGPRAAQAVSDTVGAAGGRLLRWDRSTAGAAAYAAIAELPLLATDDFLGFGLDERFTTKLLANLALTGCLGPAGEVLTDRLPAAGTDFVLASDFDAYAGQVFDFVAACCGTDPDDGPFHCYPSDLAGLDPELSDLQLSELYDNLVFHGHLEADGTVRQPELFTGPGGRESFPVTADFGDLAEPVLARLRVVAARFGTEPIDLDPAVFAHLGLTEVRLQTLLDSLRFNGWLDGGRYRDPVAMLALSPRDLDLALEFYPLRPAVLDAIRGDLIAARTWLLTLTADDLRGLVDREVAQWIGDRLEGAHVFEGRLTEQAAALAGDPDLMLTVDGFTDAECATIAGRLATIAADGRPYRADLAVLTELGLTDDEREQLLSALIDAGHLTGDLMVAQPWLTYFGQVHHALEYLLPGLADYSQDVFFVLHAAATETTAAVDEITAALTARTTEQHAAVLAVLQEEFEAPAPAVEAICAAVLGSVAHTVELLVAPASGGGSGITDPDVRRAVRRIRGFARFAAKLGLTGTQVTGVFHEQDLTGKFPEPLALPAGVDRIDALLERADGTAYLFRGREYWTYGAVTHQLTDPRPAAIDDLSRRFAALTGIDAAFVDAAGTEWIVGRDSGGRSHSFTRAAGHTQFLPRPQSWGVVRNVFDDPARIDAAFVDEQGRTYLFAGDQYVRYSTADFSLADEGYPRSIGDWWEGDRRQGQIPPRFRSSLDAAFHGLDGRTHLFAGDRVLSVGGASGDVQERPVAEVWGRVANALAGTGRVDAAYADGPAVLLFAGNQVFRYSDSIENEDVRADEGYPCRIESVFEHLPAEFEGGVEAAFRDATGAVHLFQDGRTVTVRSTGSDQGRTAERWGRLGPVLSGGAVDAAMVGLDGHTYLFSGTNYLRYTGSDYAVADTGYPRAIAGDWGGLERVDTAFVLDGVTHLFGPGRVLFTLPVEVPADQAADLAAGELPRVLRRRLAEHAVVVAPDATVTATGSGWQVPAELDLTVELHRTAETIEVHAGRRTGEPLPCEVRYSGRDHRTPDPGFPRPMTDNFWNLPDDLAGPFDQVDAVFTGRDGRTYLFAGGEFISLDSKRRWWSQPRAIKEQWDSLPFDRVDAAFVGTDDKTYMFHGPRYARYSSNGYTRLDDRYPAMNDQFWGNVINPITRTGRVDAALVVGEHTYLFSGDQFVRYTGSEYTTVDVGYPRRLSELNLEPRLAGLTGTLTRVDTAFADRGTVYLISGDRIHAVSEAGHRRYPDLAVGDVRAAFLADGGVRVEQPDGWQHYSALEGLTVTATPDRPRVLRGVPSEFGSDLDAVLTGRDGNVHLFKGARCYNTRLRRDYPLAEEWGRPRNNVFHDNTVDAVLAGANGRTYVFSGDQFVTYTGDRYLGVVAETGPRPVAEHWAGLTAVALAYVQDGVTYLFEPPDEVGLMRYVTYSGADYTTPDDGGPALAGPDFWGIPQAYRPVGFTRPDAVLVTGSSMLVLIGGQAVQRDGGAWSYPRPLERLWPGIGDTSRLRTAFTGRDGATYFFHGHEFARYADGAFTERRPIREHWALTRNNFLAGGADVVDAAAVVGEHTYLFAGDQYVRYTDPECRYADFGYPRPIVANLRTEPGFAGLPVAFDEEIAQRYADGSRSMIDAVVSGAGRTVYLFVGRTCHAVSAATTATYDLDRLGRIRNTIADRQRVDAALVDGTHTYLFSGDQFVRYTGGDYLLADEGYPKPLSEFDLIRLPQPGLDGIDAALAAADGSCYVFTGRTFLHGLGTDRTEGPIAGTWGRVDNEFGRRALDAAFVTAAGELYAFCGSQFVRYAPGSRFETADEGYPLRIRNRWGDLPSLFEDGIDGAFRLDGRVYLQLGDDVVRFGDDRFATLDAGPGRFRHRFTDTADYRIDDLRAIQRYIGLTRAHPQLHGFLLPGSEPVSDPYRLVASAFGWDERELKWCRRHSRFLSGGAADERRFELEFLLEVADLFALAGRFGVGPSQVFAEVWARVHDPVPDLDAAGAAVRRMLAAVAGSQWPVLARQLHDEFNLRLRAVLVEAVLAGRGLTDSRALFDRFLIDVDMGSRGMTSRVREAIAAVQLYVHRFLLGLELHGPEESREKIKSWWTWMRNYRVWEANRKVFLYPENYLRPELRLDKTPAFTALEGDLLQGEITANAVELAYKRYLDEYSEVSRLTIAGGYVYSKDQDPDGPRRMVLFGRTKTDPRRYYYRRAEFGTEDDAAALWEPWRPVNVQIGADLVHPVHAFGRVFVFWAMVEPISDDDPGQAVVTVTGGGADKSVSAEAKRERVTIYYSFYNLTGEWVPAQRLGSGARENGVVSAINLLTRPRLDQDGRMSIMVSCSYTVSAAGTDDRRAAVLLGLNPELYADDLLDPAAKDPEADALQRAGEEESKAAGAATTDRVAQIFVDPVDPAAVVRFDSPSGADAWPWFSVDVKGGSFLCRPAMVAEPEDSPPRPLRDNKDRLPVWDRIDAAFELTDEVRYFFDSNPRRGPGVFSRIAAGTQAASAPLPISSRWGRKPTVLPEDTRVDAVFTRPGGGSTYAFFGDRYVRFTGEPFRLIDDGYPKRINEAPPEDALPRWTRVDLAFTDVAGTTWFYNEQKSAIATSKAPGDTIKVGDFLQQRLKLAKDFGRLVAVQVIGPVTYIIGERRYARFTHVAGTPEKNWWEEFDGLHDLAGNTDGLPTGIALDAAMWKADTAYYVHTDRGRQYLMTVAPGHNTSTRPVYSGTKMYEDSKVDAAWVDGDKLYLTYRNEYYVYTLTRNASSGAVSFGDFLDEGYPKPMTRAISAAFRREDQLYLFSNTTRPASYVRVPAGQDLNKLPVGLPIAESWVELPENPPRKPFDGVLDSPSGLFLFAGDKYHRHSQTLGVRRPYEKAATPFEIIRLTTGTASELNRRLLSGGVPALLDLSTQLTDEVLVSTDEKAAAAVRVRRFMVDTDRLPSGTHLDFQSANGAYYWEIFCHAPLLIAQALNSAQRFEDARRWYEYVFDPTDPRSYWRFLPFLAFDPGALADTLDADLAAAGLTTGLLAGKVAVLTAALRTVAPAVRTGRAPAPGAEQAAKDTLASARTHTDVADSLRALPPDRRTAIAALTEHTLIAAEPRVAGPPAGQESLLKAYRDRPFDPHAIAGLRPAAYRRSVVMGYIDNLLDWGDMLFRQYTPESVDEARMLYVLAYDLLGARPERLGTRLLPDAESFAELDAAPGDLNLLGHLTSGGAMLQGGGNVHAGVADEYFTIPENDVFAGYWTRVEDRLHKIRESLNILGIAQPLPLFAPPIDPMALVRATAAGVGPGSVLADVSAAPPHHRFGTIFRKAQDLADKVTQFGNELLSVLERGSAEELSLLHNRQEQAILAMTVNVKQEQIRIGEETLRELAVSREGATERAAHYAQLLDDGMNALERGQVGAMSSGAALHMASGVLSTAAAIVYHVPQFKAGPFIIGVEHGGRQLGDALSRTAEITSSFGEGLSMIGEVLGVQAQHERMTEDWTLQAATARNESEQLVHRIAGAEAQLAVARHEADILDREIAHGKAVATFLTGKFTGAELYSWMAGRMSALYFQLYQLAYDTAKAAEQAYRFEQGAAETFIRPGYWEGRRGGLLAGAALAVDLERLGHAHRGGDARGLEITKQISLLDLDPLAVLRLRETGDCEFALTEALFDEDFPGHYKRQVRTVTVTFVDADDQPLGINGTLTQLSHKTVLEADTRAVKQLLDPQGAAPGSIRADWRPGQRIALSQPDGGRDNNGLFELRYDDERYLPFEGTGAVSTWRLERSPQFAATLYDVFVTVKYTAEHGGEAFINAVRGLLRPRRAARFFDVAREFPQQWADFQNGSDRLVLPLSTDMFPGMVGRQVTGVLPAYEPVDGGTAQLVLGGDPAMVLRSAQLLPTPGHAVRDGSAWEFTVDGDKTRLGNVGLVLTYQARTGE
jgi:hypothetical protein